MFGFGERYNYDRFTREMMDPAKHSDLFDDAPAPGERAPDFEARTLNGDRVQLSDYQDEKNVVLVFGSATCPMTAGSIGGLNELYKDMRDEHDDIEFLFVYVREAHPGEKVPAHRTWEQKLDAAEHFREAEEVEMSIVVDDLRGSIHKKYSKLPNPAFLIDKSGCIAYRMMWTQPAMLAAAIEELLELEQERGVDHVVVQGGEDLSIPMSYMLFHSYRALERGGETAMTDFREALGVRGRMALATSRIAEPVAEHAGTIALTAAISGAVLAGGLLAGAQLRKRRLARAQEPYRYPWPAERPAATGTNDFEPMGI